MFYPYIVFVTLRCSDSVPPNYSTGRHQVPGTCAGNLDVLPSLWEPSTVSRYTQGRAIGSCTPYVCGHGPSLFSPFPPFLIFFILFASFLRVLSATLFSDTFGRTGSCHCSLCSPESVDVDRGLDGRHRTINFYTTGIELEPTLESGFTHPPPPCITVKAKAIGLSWSESPQPDEDVVGLCRSPSRSGKQSSTACLSPSPSPSPCPTSSLVS